MTEQLVAHGPAGVSASAEAKRRPGLVSRRTGAMLIRNTAVSCLIFGLNIVLLYGLVEYGRMATLPAAALAFVVANSFQYALARKWVFAGSDRAMASGYLFALINAGVGLLVTMLLYAAVIHFTSIDYLVGRILVSVVAGLVVFVLNATLNFGRVALPWTAAKNRA